jgi:hypothetical protein
MKPELYLQLILSCFNADISHRQLSVQTIIKAMLDSFCKCMYGEMGFRDSRDMSLRL